MDDLSLEIRLLGDYHNLGDRFEISEECRARLLQLTPHSKHTRAGTRILITQLAVLFLLLLLIPATAYAAAKVSDALLEKVKNAGLSSEQIEELNRQLLESGFTEEDIKNFLPLQRNDNGQIYGIYALGADLIAATSAEGLFGYVYREDLDNEPDFKTPEEALAWQASRPPERIIPVYESDGKTVIGTFVIKSGN
jgi:hypothetical protein